MRVQRFAPAMPQAVPAHPDIPAGRPASGCHAYPRQSLAALGAAALLLMLVPVAAMAQATATVNGSVKDETNAVLPGITVTAKQEETGLTRTAVSDARGVYRLFDLTPGTYAIRAELQGFRTTVRSGITLRVGDARTVDVVMQLGELSEEVRVTGEAPLIERMSAVIGGVVERTAIANLPLNGRGFSDLALLQPNVVWSSTSTNAVNQGYGQRISVSGMRPISNSYTLDGQDIADFFNDIGGVSGAAAGIEAVREFKVVTSPYSAEYGKTGAGEIQVVTKSGTNRIEATGYEYMRNSSFDSPNYFDVSGKPPFRRNQFGGSIGGPIVGNKTFFFGNYEGLREKLGTTSLFNVPDANAHNGYVPDGKGGLRFVGIGSNIAPLLALMPLPTRAFGDGRGEYPQVASKVTTSNYWMARVDHALTPAVQIYGRYSQDTGSRNLPKDFFFDTVDTSQARYLAIEANAVLSPRLVNSVQFGLNRSGSARFNQPRGMLSRPELMQFTTFVDHHGPVFGAISGASLSAFGGESILIDVVQNVYQFKDDASLAMGRHTVKFGGNFEYFRPDMFNSFNGGGAFTFSTLTDFLAGSANNFTSMLPGGQPESQHKQHLLGLYVQDDIRLTSKVTLNLGVRHERAPAPVEFTGRMSNERNFLRAGIQPQDATIGEPYYVIDSNKNFAPRLGVVWSLNEKTSLRGGFGTFFDHILGYHWRQPATQTYPFFLRGQVRRAGTTTVDFPNAFTTQPKLLAASLGIEAFQFNVDQPMTSQYTLNLQREIGTGQVLSVSYVGSRGWNLLRVQDYGVRTPTVMGDGTLFFAPNAPIRSPAMERVRGRTTDGTSFYDALSMSFQQRLRRGLSYQASYTFSKSIDTGSAVIGTTDYGNDGYGWRYPLLPPDDLRGLSAFDVRHNFIFNATFELPFGAGRARQLRGMANALAGGWNVNTVVKLTDGPAFSVTDTRVSMGLSGKWGDLATGAPNLKAGANSNPVHPQNPTQYFDPTMFELPPPGYQGNLGRNTLIGPGLSTFDLSLVRNIRLVGDAGVQIRAEFFNIFNTVNLGLPERGLFNSNGTLRGAVGRITETATPARQMQLGVKFTF